MVAKHIGCGRAREGGGRGQLSTPCSPPLGRALQPCAARPVQQCVQRHGGGGGKGGAAHPGGARLVEVRARQLMLHDLQNDLQAGGRGVAVRGRAEIKLRQAGTWPCTAPVRAGAAAAGHPCRSGRPALRAPLRTWFTRCAHWGAPSCSPLISRAVQAVRRWCRPRHGAALPTGALRLLLNTWSGARPQGNGGVSLAIEQRRERSDVPHAEPGCLQSAPGASEFG